MRVRQPHRARDQVTGSVVLVAVGVTRWSGWVNEASAVCGLGSCFPHHDFASCFQFVQTSGALLPTLTAASDKTSRSGGCVCLYKRLYSSLPLRMCDFCEMTRNESRDTCVGWAGVSEGRWGEGEAKEGGRGYYRVTPSVLPPASLPFVPSPLTAFPPPEGGMWRVGGQERKGRDGEQCILRECFLLRWTSVMFLRGSIA